MSARTVLQQADIPRALTRIAHEILESNRGAEDLVILGIPTRGVAARPADRRHPADRAEHRAAAVPVGALDVTMYRDDLSSIRPAPRTDPVPGRRHRRQDRRARRRRALLGPHDPRRARRAATTSAGRAAVRLAVLVDRGHRELPIRADFVGKNLPSSRSRAHLRAAARDRRRGVGRDRGRATHEAPALDTRTLAREDAMRLLDVAEDMADVQPRQVQEAPDAARQDRGEPVLRGLHPHPHLVRGGRQAALGRRDQLRAKGSSVSKGESLKDTAQTLEAMGADAVVVRHPASGAPRTLATSGWIDAGVVNAGDGTHEHPTQALLDAYTMRKRRFGADSRGRDLDGVRVVIVGDILHSRVARSNVWLLTDPRRRGDAGRPADAAAAGRDGWPVARAVRPRRGARRGAGRR